MLFNGKLVDYPGADQVVQDIAFRPGSPNTTKQAKPWAGLGIHWTGGEGKPSVLKNVLKSRKLSVHFANPAEGRLIQFADLNTVCAHIGKANHRFIGVETTCRGYATKEDWQLASLDDPDLREREDLDWDVERDVYVDQIGGREVKMAAFNPSQIENLLWLSEALAHTFKYPRRIPWREATALDAHADTPIPGVDLAITFGGKTYLPDFSRDVRLKGRMATFSGTLGHFHIHPTKHDPGTQIWYRLWCAGWNPAEKIIKLP
jgi:hypothetical protein